MLGRKLREALGKLTGRAYVDEAAVKSLIKDLQRVLIASDVNVKLVLELSKKIEKRALETEQLKGLSLKEHVMKVVYEELVVLMGESYSPRLDKHKILVCGLFGSGKCIHKDSIIPLADGQIKTIKEIYDEYGKCGEEVIEDGFKAECVDMGPEVYAFNKETLKIEKRKVSALWKLKKDSKLLKISLDNGNNHSIIVTPEHPFFVLDEGKVKQVRADQLAGGAHVATSAYLDFDGKLQNIDIEIIDKLDNFVIKDPELSSFVRKTLLKKFSTLKNAHNLLQVKEAYCTFTTNLKHGCTPFYLIKKLKKSGVRFDLTSPICVKGSKQGAGGSVFAPLKLPLTLNEELAEFLGYIIGDGYVYKNYVEVTNNDYEILLRMKELSKNLFGLNARIKTDKRNGVKKVFIASGALVSFLTGIFGFTVGKKSSTIKLPDLLLKSPRRVLKLFIRAYFDTDGYVEKGSRHIEFCSASKVFLEQFRIVLLRYGMFSNISKKSINGKEYYRLFLKSDDVNKFNTKISSLLPRKKSRLEDLSKITGQTPGKHQLIQAGNLLRGIRESHGFSIGEVQNYVSSYGIYEGEGEISRSSLLKFLAALEKPHKNWLSLIKQVREGKDYRELINENTEWATASLYRLEQQNYLSNIDGQYQVTIEGMEVFEGSQNLDIEKLSKLRALAHSDVCWLEVRAIEEVGKEDYVYDLTVDDLHTFIANGIIVHNTTSAGKLAHFYKTKGLSVGLVGADVDRPAAQEQLEQLAKQAGAKFYTIKGEKDAPKIVEKAMKETKEDVLIVDSAGRSAFDDELVAELKGIHDALKPDEVYLVLSGDIGQVAGKQAEQFNTAVPLSGVVVTKMDGSAKGGGALSAVASTGTKIAFIGLGEKMGDMQVYNAEKFVGRLLGVPDIEGLMEKVKEATKGQDIKKVDMEELTIESFYEQLKAAKKMGPLGNVFSMLGANDVPKEMVQQGEAKMKQYEAMINSMTKAEKKNPSLIKSTKGRVERIAQGSGTSEKDVREFLSQFDKMEKMMNKFKRDRGFRRKLEKMMKGGGMQGIPGM